MTDANLVRTVADAGEIAPGDRILEIGPGTGTLTGEMLARGARVLAVEIDRDLAGILRTQFADQPHFELIEGDALDGKHALAPELLNRLQSDRPWKLVANLPYNVASPLIVELLRTDVQLLAFTVQREVAERLRATPGSDAWGPLTVMVQSLGSAELLRILPPTAFWPAPSIDSALVVVRREDHLTLPDGFSEFIHRLFAYRRKTLRRALFECDLNADAILSNHPHLDPQTRPETLDIPTLQSLFRSSQST